MLSLKHVANDASGCNPGALSSISFAMTSMGNLGAPLENEEEVQHDD